jgi:hypothetical protein
MEAVKLIVEGKLPQREVSRRLNVSENTEQCLFIWTPNQQTTNRSDTQFNKIYGMRILYYRANRDGSRAEVATEQLFQTLSCLRRMTL